LLPIEETRNLDDRLGGRLMTRTESKSPPEVVVALTLPRFDADLPDAKPAEKVGFLVEKSDPHVSRPKYRSLDKVSNI